MKLIAIVILAVLATGCAGQKVFIQGIDTDWVKERNWIKIAAGFAASSVAHEIGHVAAIEYKGYNWNFDRGSYLLDSMISYNHETDNFVQRAGFLTQLGIGMLLNIIPATKASDFTLGWNAATVLGLTTYPIRYGFNEGDFETLSKGEYGVYTLGSAANLVWTMYNSIDPKQLVTKETRWIQIKQ